MLFTISAAVRGGGGGAGTVSQRTTTAASQSYHSGIAAVPYCQHPFVKISLGTKITAVKISLSTVIFTQGETRKQNSSTEKGVWRLRKHVSGCENALGIAKALFGKVDSKTQKGPIKRL